MRLLKWIKSFLVWVVFGLRTSTAVYLVPSSTQPSFYPEEQLHPLHLLDRGSDLCHSQAFNRPCPAITGGLGPKPCWGLGSRQDISPDNWGRFYHVLPWSHLLVQTWWPTSPRPGITRGEHSTGSRDTTTILLVLSWSYTGSWVIYTSVAPWLLCTSTRWQLCDLIVAPLNAQIFLRAGAVCSCELRGLTWM